MTTGNTRSRPSGSRPRRGRLLLQAYGRVSAREKGPADLVTEADFASQQLIADRLGEAFPDHTLLAEEEGAETDPDNPWRWIVDPLDGTMNFAHGFPVLGRLDRPGTRRAARGRGRPQPLDPRDLSAPRSGVVRRSTAARSASARPRARCQPDRDRTADRLRCRRRPPDGLHAAVLHRTRTRCGGRARPR